MIHPLRGLLVAHFFGAFNDNAWTSQDGFPGTGISKLGQRLNLTHVHKLDREAP